MKKTLIKIFTIFLILTIISAKPIKDELENKKYLKKKIQIFKSRLAHFNDKEREIFSKKLIQRLRNHFYPRQMEGPWMENGELFARML